MTVRTQRIIMNGVTGRMGYRQHLLRSILAIRDDGGVRLADGDRIQVEPVLVGRNSEKLAELAARHDIAEFTTDLDEALADERSGIYFDAQVTPSARRRSSRLCPPGRTSTPRSPSPRASRRDWRSPRPVPPPAR